EEAGAELLDREAYALADVVEETRTEADRGVPPHLQPAHPLGGALRHLETGGVQEPVQKNELAEQLAVEDRFQIEFDVRRGGKGVGVAQQAKLAAVGEQRPQVGFGAVQRFLEERLGCRSAGSPAL